LKKKKVFFTFFLLDEGKVLVLLVRGAMLLVVPVRGAMMLGGAGNRERHKTLGTTQYDGVGVYVGIYVAVLVSVQTVSVVYNTTA
jgi:hypothetical protein